MSDRISIEISKDLYRAVAMLKPEEGTDIGYAEIINALEEAGVIHGIVEDRIKKVVEEKQYFRRFTPALYTPPVQGVNAKVEFQISAEPSIKETPDGRVDYYDLDQFKSISKGQPLIRKTAPTEGTPGMTVTGMEIPARQGEDIDLKEFVGGKGVAIDPTDEMQIIANLSGVYSKIGNRIDIKDVLTISKDVGFSVGNIKSPAKLQINGDVKAGFELFSEKDIYISGVVENATLESKADINVMKGIVKGNAPIRVAGTLRANYITERTFIKAGAVDVKNTIIGCRIYAEKSVKAQKIVGGKIIVGRSLEVDELGNQSGGATRIEVGVDAILLTRIRKIGKEIQALKKQRNNIQEILIEEQFQHEEAVDNLENLLFSKKRGSSQQLVMKLEETLKRASLRITEISSEINEIKKSLQEKMDELEKITPELAVEDPVIIVKNTVYSNVSIKMGMLSEIRTKKEGKNLRFELSDDGKIQIKSNVQ